MKQTPTAIRSREYRARKKAGVVTSISRSIPRGATLDVTHNTAEATWVGRILTLEDLLYVCKVDLLVWKVAEYTVNKWEIGAKNKTMNMVYKKGVGTGFIDQEGIVIEPLFQVKARLVRINPEPITPVVAPVVIRASKPGKPDNYFRKGDGERERVLILPDVQIGFRKSLRTGELTPHHDRRAMDIAVQIAADIKPDHVVFIGDLLDLADWSSKFLRTPNLQYTTQPSLIEAAWWMARVRRYADRAYLLEGNHEERMVEAIVKDMPEAYGLRPVDMMDRPPALSVPNLLGLDSLDIEWVGDYPNGEITIGDSLSIAHGDTARGKSGATVASLIDDMPGGINVVGHIHRIECAYNTLWHGPLPVYRAAWSFGCLCLLDGQVPGVRAHQNWQQGLGVIDYYPSLGGGLVDTYDVHPVVIDDGVAVFEGKPYHGTDRVEELKADTGWPF
jgi:hypothetical protein